MQVKKILLFSKNNRVFPVKQQGILKNNKVFQCRQQVLWEAYVLRFSQMPHYDCHFMLQKAVAEFVVARFVQFFL